MNPFRAISKTSLRAALERTSGPKLSAERILELERPELYKWMKKLNSLPSVEQRLVELNSPKLYGWHNSRIDDKFINLGTEDLFKFVTRTSINTGLPKSYYGDGAKEFDAYISKLIIAMKDLLVHNFYSSATPDVNASNHSIVRSSLEEERFFNDFAFMLGQELGCNLEHFQSADIQTNVEVKHFWLCNNMIETPQYREDVENLLKHRHPRNVLSETRSALGKYGVHAMRSSLVAPLSIRTQYPLPNVMDQSDSTIQEGEDFQKSRAVPVVCGVEEGYNRAIIVPGFLPGMSSEFGHLYLHSTLPLNTFFSCHDSKYKDIALEQKLIISGFAQASAHAFYQGATPFLDPKVPVTQQTIITDGQFWKCGVYQLNRTCMVGDGNSLQNILWCSEDMKLYDCIENGEVKGFNEDVFGTIMKMVLKPTRTDRDKRDCQFLMETDHSGGYKKAFNEEIMHLMSDKPVKRPEMQTWERIFKFETKASKRQLKPTPFDEHMPKLLHPEDVKLEHLGQERIPKACRIHPHFIYSPRLDAEKLFVFPKKRTGALFRNNPDLFTTTGRKPDPEVPDPYMYRRY